MHLSGYLKWKISLVFYVLKKKKAGATVFPSNQPLPHYFQIFIMKLHLWRAVAMGENRGEYHKKLKRQRYTQHPVVTWRGKYKARLSFGIIEHYLNFLWVFLDIKMCLGISPFYETTPKNQEYTSASSNCCGVGKETVAMQSDKDSLAGWQSIIALFAL